MSPTPAPATRPRLRVLLPARVGRSRKDPDEDAAESAGRLRLNSVGVDALLGVLRSDAFGVAPWLKALFDQTLVRPHHRRQPDGELLAVPAKTGRDWLFEEAHDLDACDEVLAFREAQCGTYEVRPNSCKVRICSNCERARSAELVRIYRAILESVPAKRRSFAVLTVRNVERLAGGLDHLADGVRSLRRRPIFRGGRCRMRDRDGRAFHPCKPSYCHRPGGHRRDRPCPDFRHRPVTGGLVTTEVTYAVGSPEPWHPHANLIMDAPFIEQAELADLWRAITCSDAKHRRAGWCPKECDEGSSVVWIRQVDPSGVREAIKYVTKATDLVEGDDPTQLAEFMFATRGRRMVQGFGSFYNVQLEEIEEIETVELIVPLGVFGPNGQPIVRRYKLPRWCRQCGRDTALGEEVSYEAPIVVPRIEVRLRNGVASWRPPPALSA